MIFGPAVVFDDSIFWSELDKCAEGMFIHLGEYFEQADNQPIRDAWRNVQLVPLKEGEKPEKLEIPKIEELISIDLTQDSSEHVFEEIPPATGMVSDSIYS